MTDLLSKGFWIATAERAVATCAQALLAILGVDTIAGLADVAWQHALSAAGLAALLSVLSSLARSGIGPSGPGITETLRKE